MPQRNRLRRLLDLSAEASGDLDLASVARRVAETVTEVTGFGAAVVTAREGGRCRQLAAVGTEGLEDGAYSDLAAWEHLLRNSQSIGGLTHLARHDEPPPWGLARRAAVAQDAGPDDPDGWTPAHRLVLALKDHDADTLGFLAVDDPHDGRLPTAECLELLELVGLQAQAVLCNARLYEVAERQRRAAETLRNVIETVSSTLDVQEVIKRCCDAAASHSVGERASVFLHDVDTRTFMPVMSRGIEDPRRWKKFRRIGALPESHLASFRDALERGEPIVREDLRTDELPPEERDLYDQFGLRSVAAYPLVASGHRIGVLSIDSATTPVCFPTDERELIAQIARHAAIAIRQARLHTAAQDQASRIGRLHELTKAMAETFNFSTIFGQLSEAVRSRGDIDAVTVVEVGDDAIELLQGDYAGSDLEHPELPFRTLPIQGSFAELLRRIRRNGSVVIDDLSRWPEVRAVAPADTRALLAAGHLQGEGVNIVLVATSSKRTCFSRNDAAFLRELVEVAAVALRNARLYEETKEAAERDSLTGLKNRRLFWAELDAALTGAGAGPTALTILDVDDFKGVNDRYGHAVGDQVLHHVADRLQRTVRETDSVYRIGGDEFAILMPQTSREEACQVIERATSAVARSRKAMPVPTLSAGIAIAPADGDHGDALFSVADAAMYVRKREDVPEEARDTEGWTFSSQGRPPSRIMPAR